MYARQLRPCNAHPCQLPLAKPSVSVDSSYATTVCMSTQHARRPLSFSLRMSYSAVALRVLYVEYQTSARGATAGRGRSGPVPYNALLTQT